MFYFKSNFLLISLYFMKGFYKNILSNCSTITLIVCSYSLNDIEYVLLAYL